MASERFLSAVNQTFTADGTVNGQVHVATARGFKVKATVVVYSVTKPPLTLEIKRIIAPHIILVGPKGASLEARADLSAYLASDVATIEMPRQERRSIGPGEIDRAVYEEEPVVARRTIQVDEFGDKYSADNRFPVDPAGQQMTIMNNLLAMQVAGVSPSNFIANNDGFFVFDNSGNLIKVG